MNKRIKIAGLVLTVSLAPAAFLVGRSSAGVVASHPLTYSGILEDAKGAISGTPNIEIKLWSGGKAPLCTTSSQPVMVTNGHFSVPLPADCVDALEKEHEVEIEVLVNGGSLERRKLGAVPYALQAKHATSSAHSAMSDHAATAERATSASAATDALDSRLAAIEGAAIAVDRHAWGYIACQPLMNLRQSSGTNVLIRASLYTDSTCTTSAHGPHTCHEFCAAQYFNEGSGDASNCCGVSEYYTDGIAETLVIRPTG